jgi:hypothetical protein
MKKLNIVSPKKKTIVIFLVIIILLVASQWWSIRMIYARKLNNDTALFLAKVYRLTAGIVVTASSDQSTIYLADYIADEEFAFDYIKKQAKASNEGLSMTDQQIRETAWEKVLRQTWVDSIAEKNKISISPQDIEDFYASIGGQDTLEQGLKNADINVGRYKNFVILPSIIEAKVYKYLLDNFNDLAGMQKAQNAYKALVDDKGVFEEVAQKYSDDMTYVEDSMFVNLDELGEFGEPLKQLKTGEYSKIMVLPGNPGYYVIWLLKGTSLDEETQQEVKELRGIAIKAKSMDEFYADWKNNSKINQWYK